METVWFVEFALEENLQICNKHETVNDTAKEESERINQERSEEVGAEENGTGWILVSGIVEEEE